MFIAMAAGDPVGMDTLPNIIANMQELFDFFIGLFVSLFGTITSTPIIWAPLALSLLFMVVWKVPKMVRRLRKI